MLTHVGDYSAEADLLFHESLCHEIELVQIDLVLHDRCPCAIDACLHAMSIELFVVGVGG